MCRVNGDVLPECPCPTECSDDVDPHCSVFLGDYENLCKVHLHACKMQINVGVKHRGRCAGMGPLLSSEYFTPHKNEVYFLCLKKGEYVTQNDGYKPRSYASLKIYHICKIAGVCWEKYYRDKNKVTATRAIAKRVCCMAPSTIFAFVRPSASLREYVMVHCCCFDLIISPNRGFNANHGNVKHPSFSLPMSVH